MCIQQSTTSKNLGHAMLRVVAVATLSLGLFGSKNAVGQGIRGVAQGSAMHQSPSTCLILQRRGTVDKVTSRVFSLGTHKEQFQYLEGKVPAGLPFHDKLTEREVSDLQARGAEVVIVSSDLMPDELQQAREYCRAETRKPLVQPGATEIEISSTPFGSDIELDGKFIGSTPSSLKLSIGEHTIKLSKNGYAIWERTITTVAGNVRISPELEPVVETHNSAAEAPTNLLSTAGKQF